MPDTQTPTPLQEIVGHIVDALTELGYEVIPYEEKGATILGIVDRGDAQAGLGPVLEFSAVVNVTP